MRHSLTALISLSLLCLQAPVFALSTSHHHHEAAMSIPAELNWSPENQTKIDQFFQAGDLKGQVAVFDADETLWRHDVGEGFLKFLQERSKLAMVPPGFDAFKRYEELCAQNKWMGYPYAAQVMAGMSVTDVEALAKEYFENHFKQNVYPAQKALIQRLQAAGVDVYIVSASNQWIINAGAPALGVPLDHAIGVRLEVAQQQVTAHIIPPMTFRQGKVDAIKKYIGKQPVLVSGDSITDYEMLQYASRLQLVINPKDKNAPEENIFRLASQHAWAIQRW